MRSPLRLLRVILRLVGIAGLAACGGQTGEGDYGSNECVDLPAEPLGDTERSRLGFSADQILAFAGEQHFELHQPGSAASPLPATARLRLRSDSVRFVPTRPRWDIGRPDACRGRIELDADLDLTVTTPRGDLQLSAASKLRADSPHRARLTAQLLAADFDALRTFDLLDGESLAGFELRAQLTPAGSAGELAATVEFLVRVGSQPSPNGDAPRVRDYTSQRDAEVAHWPAESACARGELPVAADQMVFELTPKQIVQMLAMPRTLRWDDGATTTLRLNVTGMGTACLADLNPEWLSPIEWPPIVPEDPAVFGVMVDIAIATDDGRFQSDASVMLQYQARKTGGLERAWFQHVAKLAPGDPGGWAADAADHGSQRATRLQVSVPSSEGSSMLLLHGPPAAASSCSAPSSMCPGLPPSLTTLLRGTIE